VHDPHEFLKALTIVLGVAAVVTVLFHRLRLPVVLGYVIAGLIVGPHVPVPLVADPQIVQTLSELGVILLMLSLGLEFRLSKLASVGPTAGLTAVIQSGIMAWLGFLVGRAFGWSPLESVFAGAAVAISSTTIIAKVFDEQKIGGKLRDLVVGILLFEDLIAIVFMAALTAVATGSGLSAGALAVSVGRLAFFLVVLLAMGMLVVPRFIRFVRRTGGNETTVVATIGICFTLAYVAQEAGYSVALGAFLAGSLVAESGEASEIEHLVEPVRDIFAAIFFVSVGMLINPALVAQHYGAILVLTAVVLLGKTVGVALGAFLTGAGTQTSVKAGMSLAQIGEFSFIIAGLGLQLGATREFLYPVTVAVSAITTLSTPWLIRASPRMATFVDRKLPRPLQTFATFYAAWIERLRAGAAGQRKAPVARIVRLLILDLLVLAAIVIAVALNFTRAGAMLTSTLGVEPSIARALVVAVAALVCLPFAFGIGRLSARLGRTLAEFALPHSKAKVDFDAAPRRALSLTLELGVALVAGAILLVVTQPFLPSYAGPVLLGLIVTGFGFAIWRSATDLEGHVRAGSLAVAQALAKYAHAREEVGKNSAAALKDVHTRLPGLGAPIAVKLENLHAGVGQTLSQLNLRGQTGATVLAIWREGQAMVAPDADERLMAGDVIALAGTQDGIEAARVMLTALR
jgi:CPA2 family monovalent cation:H+ antiporter-2